MADRGKKKIEGSRATLIRLIHTFRSVAFNALKGSACLSYPCQFPSACYKPEVCAAYKAADLELSRLEQ